MNKLAILLTTILAAGFVSLKMTEPAGEECAWADAQKIQEKFASYKCFKETLEITVDELGKGEVRLSEARARVVEAAGRYHPQFFPNLVHAEPGKSDDERVAHNLVGHVRSLEDIDPNIRIHLPALEKELQELVGGRAIQSALQNH